MKQRELQNLSRPDGNMVRVFHDTAFRRVLWLVLTGTRGGINRIRVITSIAERPLNAHQVALQLNMHYKTVSHHLNVLRKNHLILKTGEGYGAMYFPSPELEENYEVFMSIRSRMTID